MPRHNYQVILLHVPFVPFWLKNEGACKFKFANVSNNIKSQDQKSIQINIQEHYKP